MKFLPLSLLLLVSLGSAEDLTPRNVLTCSICKDIITEIGKEDRQFVRTIVSCDALSDEWITSDKTEQDIIDFFNQICLVRSIENINNNYFSNNYLYCSGSWRPDPRSRADLHRLPEQQHARHHRVHRPREPQPQRGVHAVRPLSVNIWDLGAVKCGVIVDCVLSTLHPIKTNTLL